jgi:transcriptional regulator with XRE-family HTH domain
MITTAQIRGARGILNWSQGDLSDRTDISATSIGSIENGLTQPRESTLSIIQKSFEDAGIEFLSNDGIRKKTGEVKIFQGRAGFWDFYEDIYKTLAETPGEVVVSNVDERKFEKWLGLENLDTHVARVKKLEGITYKILLREGDDYFLATPDFGEYKWMPTAFFSSVPFYVYGQKLAILLFDAEPTVIVLDYPSVAEAYRAQFQAFWEISKNAIHNTKIKK